MGPSGSGARLGRRYFRRKSASTAYLKAGILNAALHDITNIDDGCNPYLSE